MCVESAVACPIVREHRRCMYVNVGEENPLSILTIISQFSLHNKYM